MRLHLLLGSLNSIGCLAFCSASFEDGSPAALSQPSSRDTISASFDASASDNIAVYFGRTNESQYTSLLTLCKDVNINIVILAFVTDICAAGCYPEISFDNLCDNATAKMRSEGATGLASCPDLATQITRCQGLGTKVLIGIGGQNGRTAFSSPDEARKSAMMLWNIFGGGTRFDNDLRPFGNITIDGFDIDNESGDGSYYPDFVSALAKLYRDQSAKTYYLSAAPSCNYPYSPQPLAMLSLVDWVWPQFYGAPSCNIGSDGFNSSVSNWTARLNGPRVYLGAPAFAAAVTRGGYQDSDLFAQTISTARTLAGPKFGGVMLWDGPHALLNQNLRGEDYVNVTKTALLQRESVRCHRSTWVAYLATGLTIGIGGITAKI